MIAPILVDLVPNIGSQFTDSHEVRSLHGDGLSEVSLIIYIERRSPCLSSSLPIAYFGELPRVISDGGKLRLLRLRALTLSLFA